MNNLQVRTIWYRGVMMLSTILLVFYFTRANAEFQTYDIAVKVSAENDEISVKVRSAKTCELQFYMFDMEGQLVKRYDIKGNSMFKVASLSKGTYTYDVFNYDAKLKSGKIELK